MLQEVRGKNRHQIEVGVCQGGADKGEIRSSIGGAQVSKTSAEKARLLHEHGRHSAEGSRSLRA